MLASGAAMGKLPVAGAEHGDAAKGAQGAGAADGHDCESAPATHGHRAGQAFSQGSMTGRESAMTVAPRGRLQEDGLLEPLLTG